MSFKCLILGKFRHFLQLQWKTNNHLYPLLMQDGWGAVFLSRCGSSLPTRSSSIIGNFTSWNNIRNFTKCLPAMHIRFLVDYHQSTNIDSKEPFSMVKSELSTMHDEIRKALTSNSKELECIAEYHFDGKGKSFRPMTVLLMAHACNQHVGESVNSKFVLVHQKNIAMISEMIHTASLVHDDVIDAAETRRGKISIQKNWGQRKAILSGNFILSVSSMLLARIGNEDVVEVLSAVLEDLIRGEFMQLGSRENENERFAHYLTKTYKKTASLIASSCKAVAMLGKCTDDIVEVAFQYGRNIGIAFQLVDDLLDFTSSEALMGKPIAADLKVGMATAPVLFAAQQYPELNELIMRRFEKPGDVERAWNYVSKSDGVQQTRLLADQHSKEAIRLAMKLNPSPYREALITTTQKVLNRLK